MGIVGACLCIGLFLGDYRVGGGKVEINFPKEVSKQMRLPVLSAMYMPKYLIHSMDLTSLKVQAKWPLISSDLQVPCKTFSGNGMAREKLLFSCLLG